jgi:small-conductance mechanosensitive channel
MQVLQATYLNNPIQRWLLALAIVFLCTVVLFSISKLLARSLRALNRKIPGDVAEIMADTVGRTKLTVLLIVSLYLGSLVLTLPPALANTLRAAAIILGAIQVGIWASVLVNKLVPYYMSRKEEAQELVSAMGVLSLIGRMIVWAVLLLLILDNLGFDITTLVAGLGVGGIAIGLAAQNVLADLFAALSILLDKPFRVNDFVIVGDMLGVVENIGLKTTRIRSLSGEELVFSNGDLLASRIRNYKTLQERRILFRIGVEYSTLYEKVARIPGMIREIIESIEETRFDRAHFASYGDFSLNFEVVYYVLHPDYVTYMDIQEKINLALFKRFEEEGIVFAFPTRTIHLKQSGPED